MRRRPAPTTPAADPAPPAPDLAPPESSYDWDRFGRHRFRTPAAVAIDHPLPPAAPRWIATVWPDPHVQGGWARMLWQPDPAHGRGWLIPERLALGDVLEFGSYGPVAGRWYGILDSYEVATWLTVQGPYAHPTGALGEADRLLAGERYLPALDTDARPPSTRPCARHPRRRPRHP